jgi:hypothetical protein
MPTGKGVVKSWGRSLDVLRAVKKSIVVVKAARVNCDPKYKLYGNGYLLDETVERLLGSSGIGLSNAGGLQELQQF